MQLDWITVIAQLVNFLVLLWLLKRFLFGPIVEAMQRREQRIEDRLRDAALSKREAEEQAIRLQDERAALERDRGQLIDAAKQEAAALGHELQDAARREADAQAEAWRSQLATERESFGRALRAKAAGHVYAVARTALADLASAEIEKTALDRFSAELAGLSKEEREGLASAAEASGTATVETAFALGKPAKTVLARALSSLLGAATRLDFEHNPDLLCGVRLRVGSKTVEWTLERYLDGLETAALDGLDPNGVRALDAPPPRAA
ncbi:MAG: F0F1 ATP synthase subunit delta [Pseudomonadota bacterium]